MALRIVALCAYVENGKPGTVPGKALGATRLEKSRAKQPPVPSCVTGIPGEIAAIYHIKIGYVSLAVPRPIHAHAYANPSRRESACR